MFIYHPNNSRSMEMIVIMINGIKYRFNQKQLLTTLNKIKRRSLKDHRIQKTWRRNKRSQKVAGRRNSSVSKQRRRRRRRRTKKEAMTTIGRRTRKKIKRERIQLHPQRMRVINKRFSGERRFKKRFIKRIFKRRNGNIKTRMMKMMMNSTQGN